MSFNLGELKFEMFVSQGGELRLNVKILDDKLFQMFPIDDTKRLFLSDDEYDKYVDEILDRKERWIRDNVPSGVYSFIIELSDRELKKEE